MNGALFESDFCCVVSVGLSLGYWPTILRDVPFSAFYVLFYTQSKQAVMRGEL